MKLTKERLKQIIKEELQTLSEGPLEDYMQSEKAQKDWEGFISGGMFSGGLLGKLIAKGQATASWDVEEFKNLYLKEYWSAGMEGHQDPNRVAGNVLRKKLMEIMLGGSKLEEAGVDKFKHRRARDEKTRYFASSKLGQLITAGKDGLPNWSGEKYIQIYLSELEWTDEEPASRTAENAFWKDMDIEEPDLYYRKATRISNIADDEEEL